MNQSQDEQPEVNDTPLTDSATYEECSSVNGYVKVVAPEFAKGLERQLAAVRCELEIASAAGAWIVVKVELPPLEVPVWLSLPGITSPIIGVRTLDDGEWYWAHCYGDFHWSSKSGWHTDTADCDDYKPTHWMRLPEPPDAAMLGSATGKAGETS